MRDTVFWPTVIILLISLKALLMADQIEEKPTAFITSLSPVIATEHVL